MKVLRLAAPWLLGAAIGAAACFAALRSELLGDGADQPHEVSPVAAGVLYRGGQLPPERLEAEIRRRGIKTVVNLGSDHEWDEEVCRRLGVRYVKLETGDCWNLCGCAAPGHEGQSPAGPMDITTFWEALDDPAARPLLIHCQGGVHRTGVVTAMYRIQREGWEPDDAIAEMDRFGFDSHKPKFEGVVRYLRGLSPTPAPLAKTPDGVRR
jgi:protein tyrosine phosphatase (PTP) superfamily phosphohydrolase (DUF442 family)